MQKQLQQPVGPRNCIHCHNIYDSWRNTAYDKDTFTTEGLWVYPLPDNIGLKIKIDEGNLIESILSNSPSDGLDLKTGDRIQTGNDQSVISVADLQWVLNSLPSESGLHLEAKREGVILKRTISLSNDWRKTDISWRASMWNLRPRISIHAPEITVEEKARVVSD